MYIRDSLIYNTAWFWTNASYQQYQQGSTYGGNNYAVYNGTGGNHATVPTGVVYSAVIPNGIIKVGQGFLVQNKRAEGTSGLLNFNNSYGPGQDLRVTSSGTFYTKDVVQKNRFWISSVSYTHLDVYKRQLFN